MRREWAYRDQCVHGIRVGAGAQLCTARCGRWRDGRVLTDDAATVESRLGRFALILIVPSLLLPGMGVAALLISQNSSSGIESGVGGIALIVYLFVLLGSMTLNAWLLLRHPHTLSMRVLPRSSSVVLVALWALIVAWSVVLAAPMPSDVSDGLSLAFAVLGILLSIISFFLAAARRVADGDRVPRESVELGQSARVIIWVFLVAAGLALLSYTALSVVGGTYSQIGGILGGPVNWVLILLGLPWSHPLHFLSVVSAVTIFSSMGTVGTVVTTVVPVIGVGINIALTCVLLFSPSRRTSLVNWFFRLRSTPARTPVPGPPQ